MQINPISCGYNTHFDGTGKDSLQNGSTVLAEVIHNSRGKITDLSVKLSGNKGELGAFTHEWTSGTYYEAFLQSSWIKRICEHFKLTEKQDETAVKNAIHEAEIEESELNKAENSDPESANQKTEVLSPAPFWSGADPNDSYVDVYPFGHYLRYEE
jgi:hypothetical protein